MIRFLDSDGTETKALEMAGGFSFDGRWHDRHAEALCIVLWPTYRRTVMTSAEIRERYTVMEGGR